MRTVREFVQSLTAPTLERIEGVEAETDVTFRDRILAACARRDIPLVVYATGKELDAIGKLHGLVRGGFR